MSKSIPVEIDQHSRVYTGKLPPYPHQKEALARLKDKRAFALFMYMRCVSGDTEYLSPTGWKKISSYDGGLVAEFKLDGTAHFVQPKEYIKAPVDQFWHFKSNGGTDQVLSHNHRILLCAPNSVSWGQNVGEVPNGYRTIEAGYSAFWREISPNEIEARTGTHTFYHARVPLTFWLEHNNKLDLTDDEIRLQVAFHADGSFGVRDISHITNKRLGYVSVKKEYKKQRMRLLLKAVGQPWREITRKVKPGFSIFSFRPPLVSKTYGLEWWKANEYQRRIIAEEATRWDGGPKRNARYYSSTHEQDVDFIQFCFASTGQRAMLTSSKNYKRRRPKTSRKRPIEFGVRATGTKGRSSNLAILPKIKPYNGKHDGYMYSFAVSSTYLVLRRNGKIFVTGNTGKTKCILDDFGQLELDGKVSDLLVIAPAGCYRTWPTAIDDHVANTLRSRMLIHIWESGKASTQRAKAASEAFLAARGRPRVLLVNVEALSTVVKAQEFCKAFLRDREKSMIVIDESTCAKSPKAKRTKFIINSLAPRAAYRRILSGLPTPRSPLDYFSQFNFLDPRILGFSSFWGFRNRYAVIRPRIFGGRRVDEIIGYQNVEELSRKTQPHSFRVPFRPNIPSTFSIRDVSLTEEQRRLYNEMKTYATARLSETDHVTATVVIAQIIRLHQILCGYTIDEEGRMHEIAENRTSELLELLEDYSGKAVIWCCYDYSVKKIARALALEYDETIRDGSGRIVREPEFPNPIVARFWGGNVATREAEQYQFKTNPNCRFIVGTPSAGRFGRDWSEADLVIYYASSNDLEHRDQSEMRVQGLQKHRQVDYIDLISPGTVEPKILAALRKKIDLNTTLTGDAWREWVV